MFNSIVVGIDGSEASQKALRVACEVTQKFNSSLHLVHSPQPQTVAFALGAVASYHAITTMPTEEEVNAAVDKVVKEGVEIASELGIEFASIQKKRGDPGENIVEYAKDIGADLIITGRRGLGSIGSLLQGSTTQSVNANAKCACLSVV